MPWRMIIDQANAAAESNGRFFNNTKTNRRIDSNHESECSKAYDTTSSENILFKTVLYLLTITIMRRRYADPTVCVFRTLVIVPYSDASDRR